MPTTTPSFVDRFETHLDRFLPSKGEKCSLFKCTPGKVWLVLAVLSLMGSVNMGWRGFLSTLIWEIIIGWGISWLCRGCHYGWLWTLLVIFAGIPLAVIIGALLLVKDAACPSCTSKA
jgi:hypothetical protein